MTVRYFKRRWDEPRGDQFDSWGLSIWYFEVDADGYPLRQIEVYENGPTLKYDASHIEDEYGALGDQPLDLSEFSAFEISQEEFVVAWSFPKGEPQA